MTTVLPAQTSVHLPVGEYYLQGVMETGSGFKLNDDFTFQFFFSYGALDRTGEGTWKLEGDSIVFNSRQRPAQDFALVSSAAVESEAITVHLPGSQSIGPYLHCTIRGKGQQQQAVFNASENALFRPQPVESIEIRFEFCPEKTSVFTNLPQGHTTFEFSFEPWFMDFFFENFKLKADKDRLTGAHPLMNGSQFIYKKGGKR